MNFLKQLIGDGEQPSTMRVIVLAIVIPVMIVWAWLCIQKGEFITPPWEIIAALVAFVVRCMFVPEHNAEEAKFGKPLDPYAAACLAAGQARSVQAAFAALVAPLKRS